MKPVDTKSWIEKLEVTSPIKSIMGFVNDLAANYERRLAAQKDEYKKDIEDFLGCYKKERRQLHQIIHQQSLKIEQLENELRALEQTYKLDSVHLKITKDNLHEKFNQIAMLTAELKTEQELIQIAEHTISAANYLMIAPDPL